MTKHLNRRIFLALALLTSSQAHSYNLSLAQNDPMPLYSSVSPFGYLIERHRELMHEGYCDDEQAIFRFIASPFYQKATRACTDSKERAEIGDVNGRLNMIAALPFNTPNPSDHTTGVTNSVAGTSIGSIVFASSGTDLPPGYSFPAVATNIRDNMVSCIRNRFARDFITAETTPLNLISVEGLLDVQRSVEAIYGKQYTGFFSRPMRYTKRGVRFEISGRLFHDFGFTVRTGVSTINQVAEFVDQTVTRSCQFDCDGKGVKTGQRVIKVLDTPNIFTSSPEMVQYKDAAATAPATSVVITDAEWEGTLQCIANTLMNRYDELARAYGVNTCNFNETSIEDLHGELFWRHPFLINQNAPECEWTRFIITPFAAVGGSAGIGKVRDQNRLHALPFGNNGHHSFTFNGGVTFDFARTKKRRQHIEFGIDVGFAHFFSKRFCGYRVPNNIDQNQLYPFATDVEVSPGKTWEVNLILNSFHFCNKLSFVSSYAFAFHNRDRIVVLDNDIVNGEHRFKPDVLECRSSWSSQVLNLGLNWEISPSAFLGFATQQPLARRAAYRSSTYLISLGLTY